MPRRGPWDAHWLPSCCRGSPGGGSLAAGRWPTRPFGVRARLPRWALLVGAWLAAGYWPLTPEATLLVHNVLFVAGAVSVTLAVAALSCDTVDAYGAVVAWQVTSLTRNVAWSVVVILGLLVILNGLGLSIAPMLTALGVGGLAVALALQEPLGNFFAGVFVTLAGQIRVGDYVRLDSGQEGVVVDFSWRSTRIRMLANNLVHRAQFEAVAVGRHQPSPADHRTRRPRRGRHGLRVTCRASNRWLAR